MSLLNTILSAQGGAVINQLASQFGLSPEQAQSAVSTLLPHITGQMQENAERPGGLAGLANAVSSGNHQQFLEDPSQLSSPQATEEGHGILGHLFGGSNAPEQIADQASQETGLHPSLLKSMLPVVASLAMGALGKHAETAAGEQGESDSAGGLMGAIGSILGGSQGGGLQGALGSFLGSQEGTSQGSSQGRPQARYEGDDNAAPEEAAPEEETGEGGLLGMAKKFFSE